MIPPAAQARDLRAWLTVVRPAALIVRVPGAPGRSLPVALRQVRGADETASHTGAAVGRLLCRDARGVMMLRPVDGRSGCALEGRHRERGGRRERGQRDGQAGAVDVVHVSLRCGEGGWMCRQHSAAQSDRAWIGLGLAAWNARREPESNGGASGTRRPQGVQADRPLPLLRPGPPPTATRRPARAASPVRTAASAATARREMCMVTYLLGFLAAGHDWFVAASTAGLTG